MVEIPAISASVTVPVPPDVAFADVTQRFGEWWPAESTWSQPALLEGIGMECRLGGLLTETGPHGFRVDWGRVLTWDPPSSLSSRWQISAGRVPVPDPAQASTVTVRCEPDPRGTTVTVVHDDWHRHGEGAADYRDQLVRAWPLALGRLRRRYDD